MAFLRTRRRAPRHLPTADELMNMTDSQFEAFVRASGLQTATTSGLKVEDPVTH